MLDRELAAQYVSDVRRRRDLKPVKLVTRTQCARMGSWSHRYAVHRFDDDALDLRCHGTAGAIPVIDLLAKLRVAVRVSVFRDILSHCVMSRRIRPSPGEDQKR